MNPTQKTEPPFDELTRNVLANPLGKEWIKQLRRIVNRTRIDSDNPNPNAAVYKVAQLALLRTIENQLKGILDDE